MRAERSLETLLQRTASAPRHTETSLTPLLIASCLSFSSALVMSLSIRCVGLMAQLNNQLLRFFHFGSMKRNHLPSALMETLHNLRLDVFRNQNQRLNSFQSLPLPHYHWMNHDQLLWPKMWPHFRKAPAFHYPSTLSLSLARLVGEQEIRLRVFWYRWSPVPNRFVMVQVKLSADKEIRSSFTLLFLQLLFKFLSLK